MDIAIIASGKNNYLKNDINKCIKDLAVLVNLDEGVGLTFARKYLP